MSTPPQLYWKYFSRKKIFCAKHDLMLSLFSSLFKEGARKTCTISEYIILLWEAKTSSWLRSMLMVLLNKFLGYITPFSIGSLCSCWLYFPLITASLSITWSDLGCCIIRWAFLNLGISFLFLFTERIKKTV